MKSLAIIFFLAAAACGQTPWRLTSADLSTQSIQVSKMDSAGLDYVDADGNAHQLATDRFVALQRNSQTELSSGGLVLILSDGQHWAGQALRLVGDELSWHTPLLGDLSVHLPRVTRIIRQSNSTSLTHGSNEDVVHLANGDAVHGAISAITDQQVVLQTTTASVPIVWSTVAEIDFASLDNGSAATRTADGWQVGLDDGSILHAATITWSGNNVELTLPDGKRSVQSSHLVSVEQINGPVRFLAGEEPVENVQIPLLGSPWPAKFGMDLSGDSLTEAISVHAYSRLAWAVPAGFEKFHVQYLIPSDLSLADVTVRIQIDGKNVYEQTHQHGGTISPVIDLPLNHARRLVLEVDSGNPYRTQAWLTWISPALLR